MKTFLQYLKESSLPKNVDLEDVRWNEYSWSSGLPNLTSIEKKFWGKYINHLNSWMAGNTKNKTTIKFLIDNKNKIDKKHRQGGLMYRGFRIDAFDKEWLTKAIKNKKMKSINLMESWTKSEKLAKGFAKNNSFGLVFQADIMKHAVVLDVESFVLDRKTVLLGAAATDDNFGNMGFVKGASREQEIIIDTTELAYLPFTKDFIFSITWKNKEINFEKFKTLIMEM